MANDSQKASLIAAKEELLAAYTSVHSSLGRLISLVHGSEPRAIADALGSEFDHHARSPPHGQHRGGAGQPIYPPRYPEPSKLATTTPLYPAPPQPTTQNRANGPAGPSFTAVSSAPLHQSAHNATYGSKGQHRKQRPPVNQVYNPHAVQPLETDDEEDDEDEPEEPVSDDDGADVGFYAAPQVPHPMPTPPGSVPNGKKKKVKRERDPNAPKRPASAYILFQNAVRQEMRAANPTADYKELARQIGDRWKSLSEEAKRPWSEAGKQAMNSWNIQNKEYKTAHPEAISPHTHSTTSSGGGAPPVRKKKRSGPRVMEMDEHGNPLRKKRGRPSKADREAIERQMAADQLNAQHHLQQQVGRPAEINGHTPVAPVAQTAPVSAHVPAQIAGHQQQPNGEEVTEDEEEEEEEETFEHQYERPAQPVQTNGTAQAAPTPVDGGQSEEEDEDEEEDEEELDEEEESERSAAEAEVDEHISKKMKVHQNGIMA